MSEIMHYCSDVITRELKDRRRKSANVEEEKVKQKEKNINNIIVTVNVY